MNMTFFIMLWLIVLYIVVIRNDKLSGKQKISAVLFFTVLWLGIVLLIANWAGTTT